MKFDVTGSRKAAIQQWTALVRMSVIQGGAKIHMESVLSIN